MVSFIVLVKVDYWAALVWHDRNIHPDFIIDRLSPLGLWVAYRLDSK
jgi:hypothetical protein